jgi:hypothetical protein
MRRRIQLRAAPRPTPSCRRVPPRWSRSRRRAGCGSTGAPSAVPRRLPRGVRLPGLSSGYREQEHRAAALCPAADFAARAPVHPHGRRVAGLPESLRQRRHVILARSRECAPRVNHGPARSSRYWEGRPTSAPSIAGLWDWQPRPLSRVPSRFGPRRARGWRTRWRAPSPRFPPGRPSSRPGSKPRGYGSCRCVDAGPTHSGSLGDHPRPAGASGRGISSLALRRQEWEQQFQ